MRLSLRSLRLKSEDTNGVFNSWETVAIKFVLATSSSLKDVIFFGFQFGITEAISKAISLIKLLPASLLRHQLIAAMLLTITMRNWRAKIKMCTYPISK